MDGGDSGGYVVGIESTGEEESRDALACAGRDCPVEGVPRPAARARDVGVEQHGVCVEGRSRFDVVVRADAQSFDGSQSAQALTELGRLVTVKLSRAEAGLVRDALDIGGRGLVDEDADAGDTFGETL